MSLMVRIVLVGSVLSVAGGCAHGPSPVSRDRGLRVVGAEVRVEHDSGREIRGELLAVDEGHIWVLGTEGTAREVPFADARRIRVARHGTSVSRWALAAGGFTTLGMALACATYEGEGSCGDRVAVFALVWAGVGGLAVLFVRSERYADLSGMDQLRPYARFPQGLPQGYAPGGG